MFQLDFVNSSVFIGSPFGIGYNNKILIKPFNKFIYAIFSIGKKCLSNHNVFIVKY